MERPLKFQTRSGRDGPSSSASGLAASLVPLMPAVKGGARHVEPLQDAADRRVRPLNEVDDLELLGRRAPYARPSPSAIMLFSTAAVRGPARPRPPPARGLLGAALWPRRSSPTLYTRPAGACRPRGTPWTVSIPAPPKEPDPSFDCPLCHCWICRRLQWSIQSPVAGCCVSSDTEDIGAGLLSTRPLPATPPPCGEATCSGPIVENAASASSTVSA